jgi:hypothetical protein
MSEAERYVAPTTRSILTDRAHLAAERDAYAQQVRDLTDQLVRQNAAIERVRTFAKESERAGRPLLIASEIHDLLTLDGGAS